ncbi:hypothetical protein SUGI_0613380 [Cryptomeria japonica]|nr:hypothetical protein SUGI_0613380 [Cryptomeria japonica]
MHQPDNESDEASNKVPNWYVHKNYPEEQILGNKSDGVQTRRRLTQNDEQVNFCLMIEMEPKTWNEANISQKWMNAMEEELQ